MIAAAKYYNSHRATVQNGFKLVMLCGVIWFLTAEINTSAQTYSLFSLNYSLATLVPLFAVLLLVPVNWFLEAQKWKNLMRAVGVNLSYATAYKSTLSGTAVSIFLPNRVGDSIGRMYWLPARKRLSGAVQSTVGGFAQFSITVIFGALFLPAYLYMSSSFSHSVIWLVSASVVLLATAIVLLFFKLPQLNLDFNRRYPGKKYVLKVQGALRGSTPELLRNILLLSALRYIVFALQFAVVLWLFVGSVPFITAFGCVAVVYLVSTLIPSFTLAELGIRESAAVFLLAPFSTHSATVIMATFFIWTVNIALPSLVGLAFTLARKNHTATGSPW